MSEKKVVTRFAPSPTGFMHVGGVRTALYAWLLARKNNGQFILRIEDTDKEREVEGSIEHIKKSLKWLGLNWDQGPDIGGPHASYIQSERLELYKKYADILIKKGLAYGDPYKEEEIEKFRQQAEVDKKPFLYREHRPENPPIWDGTMPLRFKISELKRTVWNDIVWGELSAGPEALDDFILIKSDGYPTYNFAHIVDDIEMEVTHIVRGQEFISSTPKFLALYEALGIKPPLFVTTPPIMGSDGKKKLGKRDGAKDIMDYEKEGYLPETMINYLAFLGFNPGGEKEVYSREELKNIFDLTKVQHSGAQWRDDKLNWFNKEHIKLLSEDQYIKLGMNWVSDEYKSKHDLEKIKDNLLFIRDSVEKFSDITNFLENKKEKIKVGEISKNIIFERKPEENDPSKMSPENKFFYLSILFPLDNIRESTLTDDVSSVFFPESKFSYLSLEPDFNHELLVWKDMKGDSTRFGKILKYLNEVLILLNQVGDWKYESLKNSIWNYANNEGKGNVLWPMRIALSGKEKSPDPFKLAEILGRDETLKRIKKTIYLLENKNIINANSQSNNIDSITNNTVTRRNSNK